MPNWKYLIRFLNRNAFFLRHGRKHDIYCCNDRIISVSRGDDKIATNTWRKILDQQLGITQEDFNNGLK